MANSNAFYDLAQSVQVNMDTDVLLHVRAISYYNVSFVIAACTGGMHDGNVFADFNRAYKACARRNHSAFGKMYVVVVHGGLLAVFSGR